jgi:hypothetical protein
MKISLVHTNGKKECSWKVDIGDPKAPIEQQNLEKHFYYTPYTLY